MSDQYNRQRDYGRNYDPDWDDDNDWDETYFDNLRDSNLEDFGGNRNYGSEYSDYWRRRQRDRLQDRGFDYYGSGNLTRSNLDNYPGQRRNYGSRFDDYYRPGMNMRGYAYDYEYGRGIDNWRDTNLEDFGAYDEDEDYGRGFDYDWQGPEYAPTFTYTEIWDIPGPQTGKGPQGYHRTDSRIEEDVCDRLAQHGQIDATGIDVNVHDGIVTLDGTVDKRSDKRLAEEVAYGVSGVQDVENNLHVDESGGTEMLGIGDIYDYQKQGTVHSRYGQGGSGMRPSQMRDRQRQDQQGQQGQQNWQGQGSHMGQGQQSWQGQGGSQGQVREGMNVWGQNGRFIGVVKMVRGNDFLIDRPMARDIFVPFQAVQRTGRDVVLKVPRRDIHRQGWEQPELFGGQGQRGGRRNR